MTSGGQNLRLNPESGAVAATDGTINPEGTLIAAVAYNNSVAGSGATTVFDIDLSENILYKQEPPNDGKLVAIGSLDIDVNAADAGFDNFLRQCRCTCRPDRRRSLNVVSD